MTLYINGRTIQTFGASRIVQGEHKAEPVTFRMNMPGASGLAWYLGYERADGEGNGTVPLETTVVGDEVFLTWEPTRTATNVVGKLAIIVYGVKGDPDDTDDVDESRRWSTLPAYLHVNAGLEVVDAEEVDPSAMEAWLARFNALYTKTIADAAEKIDSESASKITEINNAKTTALNAISSSKETAVGAVTSAKEAAVSAINASASGYSSAIATAKESAISAVEASASGYEDMITSAKEAAVSAVGSAKSSAISDMESSKISLKAELVAEKNDLKTELGNYSTEKKGELDSCATTKETEISNHTVTKKGEITTLAETKKSEITSTTSTVVGQVTSAGTTEVARVQAVYQSDLGAIASDCADKFGQNPASETKGDDLLEAIEGFTVGLTDFVAQFEQAPTEESTANLVTAIEEHTIALGGAVKYLMEREAQ